MTIDSAGTVIQKDDYYPFGLTFNHWRDSPTESQYKFNGVEFDEPTGMYETLFRGYDPALGRFMQIDPLTDFLPGISPYHFGYNNPIGYADPEGLKGKPKWLKWLGNKWIKWKQRRRGRRHLRKLAKINKVNKAVSINNIRPPYHLDRFAGFSNPKRNYKYDNKRKGNDNLVNSDGYVKRFNRIDQLNAKEWFPIAELSNASISKVTRRRIRIVPGMEINSSTVFHSNDVTYLDEEEANISIINAYRVVQLAPHLKAIIRGISNDSSSNKNNSVGSKTGKKINLKTLLKLRATKIEEALRSLGIPSNRIEVGDEQVYGQFPGFQIRFEEQ